MVNRPPVQDSDDPTARSHAPAALVEHGLAELAAHEIVGWHSFDQALDRLSPVPLGRETHMPHDAAADMRAAFITFAFGIDGVTMEIAKYAVCLEDLKLSQGRKAEICCIGGDFAEGAGVVLNSKWKRIAIPNADGWSKWSEGRTFAKLFVDELPSGSAISRVVAKEIWQEGVGFATLLCRHLLENDINLMIPVNVNSNPGNLALALGIVIASEILDLPTLNSCHDFYWEAGKPAGERAAGEVPGPRDHFFRNCGNRRFFNVFQRLLPWNGRRWMHLTINDLQARELVSNFGLDHAQVLEIGTYIEPSYLSPCLPDRKAELRQRLTYILGRGHRVVSTVPLSTFRSGLSEWMEDQQPVVCAAGQEFALNMIQPSAIWFLQPTRILARKRIERDVHLIRALLRYPPFGSVFREHPETMLILHITGPVPVEHQADLERVLDAYEELIEITDPAMARRIFLALSAGTLGHSGRHERGLANLEVSDLYKISDLVLLPSLTEGRGLPIVEAGAVGVPLVCSRYQPESVFRAVVGADRPRDQQLRYIELPEGRWTSSFLQEVTDAVFFPGGWAARALHNRRVVARRYGMEALQDCFIRGMENVRSA